MSVSKRKPFFIIKTRENTYTEPTNGFSLNRFKYSRNPTINVQNIINEFKTKMISSPSQLIEAEPGYYTWIMRGLENKRTGEYTNLKIYAIRTLSKQEIGTLHANLDLYSSSEDTNPIIAAGELKIEKDKPIMFNLLSGTFMKPIFNHLNGRAAQISLKDKLKNKFIELFPNYSKPDFLECIDCSDEEKLGGKKIIESVLIYTPARNLKYLRKYFSSPINSEINARSGGRRTRKIYRRHKTRKTKSTRKNYKNQKTKKYDKKFETKTHKA